MRIPARLVVPLFVLALASCSDDDGPTGGNGDTTPPAVAGTVVVDFNHIEVAFDESLQRASAEDPAHYVILESVVARATADRGRMSDGDRAA